MSDFEWIPVEERLPKDFEEVIVTWVNTKPASYYGDIGEIPFSGAAVFYKKTGIGTQTSRRKSSRNTEDAKKCS